MGVVLPKINKRRRGRHGGYTPLSEINVTPFVDVMLVLLIVFMVSAPLLTVSVPVDLPQAQGGQSAVNDQKPLVVSINAEGQIHVGDSPVEIDALVPFLQAATRRNTESKIFVRGDRRLAYGRMVEVMGVLSGAGFNRVALVAAPAGSGR